jgi:hypothetical protein
VSPSLKIKPDGVEYTEKHVHCAELTQIWERRCQMDKQNQPPLQKKRKSKQTITINFKQIQNTQKNKPTGHTLCNTQEENGLRPSLRKKSRTVAQVM